MGIVSLARREKSAAGIDDIKGVIFFDVPEKSQLFAEGVKSGDVILKANGEKSMAIEDLRKVLQAHPESLHLWLDGNAPAHTLVIKNPQQIENLR